MMVLSMLYRNRIGQGRKECCVRSIRHIGGGSSIYESRTQGPGEIASIRCLRSTESLRPLTAKYATMRMANVTHMVAPSIEGECRLEKVL